MGKNLVLKSDININESDLLEVEKVVIIDGDYESLVYFLVILDNSNNDTLKEINIVNSNISFFEKAKINTTLKHYPNIIVKYSKEIDIDNFLKSNLEKKLFTDIYDNDVDKEIEKLLNEIKKITKELDDKTKKIIEDRINTLFTEYQTNLQLLKPKFESNDLDLNLSIEDNSFQNLRNKLIISLENIIQEINLKINLLSLSKKINEYRNFIQGKKIEELKDDNFKKIKTILSMLENLDNLSYINRLSHLLDETQMMLANEIKKTLTNDLEDIELTLTNQDIEAIFEIKLDELLNEVKVLNDEILPYIEMLNAFQESSEESNLAKQFKTIEYIFSNISGIKKSELYASYRKIKEKYISLLIENITKIKNNQNHISIKELEFKFREELQVILEELSLYTPISLKNKDLYDQISQANNVLKDKKVHSLGSIVDLMKEIKSLLNNSLISDSIKYELENALNEIFSHWQEKLSYNDISEIVSDLNCDFGLTSENLIIEVTILKELYKIKKSLERYLSESSEYNRYKLKSKLTMFNDNNSFYKNNYISYNKEYKTYILKR